MKKIGVAVVIMLVVFFGATGVAKSAENREAAEACKAREEGEAAFVTEVRMMLAEAGYENSGINLSRVGDAENGWEYTVRIHHRKLEDNVESCEALEAKIAQMADWDACETLDVEFF